jgi:hypothetical protein
MHRLAAVALPLGRVDPTSIGATVSHLGSLTPNWIRVGDSTGHRAVNETGDEYPARPATAVTMVQR